MTRHQFVDPTPTWRACVVPHAKDPDRPRTATVGLLCTGHHAGLEQQLAELPALVADVEESLPRGSGSGGPKVGGTREQPLPYSEPVSAALRAAQAVLASWCLLVLEESPDGLHSPASDLRSLSRFLLTNLDWCAAQPWVDDLHRETREVTGALRAVLTLCPTRRVDLGPCDTPVACDVSTHDEQTCPGIMRAVLRSSDEELPAVISCTACGMATEPAQWRALSRRLRGQDDLWLTLAQLSHLLRVPMGTLKRWAMEDDWRRIGQRPKRYHGDDAHASFEAHDRREAC